MLGGVGAPVPQYGDSPFSMTNGLGGAYVKRLEAAGFLRREIDTADLRKHRLLLTPAGRKTMQRGTTLLADAFAARLGRLSPTEQAQLRSMLERLC